MNSENKNKTAGALLFEEAGGGVGGGGLILRVIALYPLRIYPCLLCP